MKLRENQSVVCIVLVVRELLDFLSFLSADQWGKSAACVNIVSIQAPAFCWNKTRGGQMKNRSIKMFKKNAWPIFLADFFFSTQQ